jgi:peroxiredoxin Q/BCP
MSGGKTRAGQRQDRRPAAQAQRRGGSGTQRSSGEERSSGAERRAELAAQRRAQGRRRTWLRAGIPAVAVAAVIGVLFAIFSSSPSSVPSSKAGAYPYQVGSPGQGQAAPGFTLAASTSGQISLSAFQGKTVLLFFQEGLTCQPCWDQIKDLQNHAAQLRAASISQVVSITGDPVGAITQKTHDMGLTIPVLSDPNLAVSQQYHANSYGMMGAGRDGHTFILVGPDGVIRWRADYGGAPKYIMFLPASNLLADIKAGEHPS